MTSGKVSKKIRKVVNAKIKAIPIIRAEVAEEIFKWLEEDCPHDITPQIPYARAKRKHCVDCWQALKKRYQGEKK